MNGDGPSGENPRLQDGPESSAPNGGSGIERRSQILGEESGQE